MTAPAVPAPPPTWSSVALAPLLLAQGYWVRARTPRLPEAAGARSGEDGRGPPLRLLVAGDSAAAGVGAEHQQEALSGRLVADLAADHRVHWRLEAQTGATTASTLQRLGDLPAERQDVALLSLGVNDVTGGLTLSAWLRQQEALYDLLRRRFGVQLLVVSGLPPVHGFPALPQPLRAHLGGRATRFDSALRQRIEARDDTVFVNLRFSGDGELMAPDGFHPGPPVYAEWARRAAAAIRARR